MILKSCEKLEKSEAKLTIQVEAAEFEAAVEKAYLKERKKIRLPGFRPGKAPRKMIENAYGEGVFYEDAVESSWAPAFMQAVEQENLHFVGDPKIDLEGKITKDGYIFTAVVALYPEVTLGQYKGLSATRPVVTVTDEDVDKRLRELADRNSRLVSVEREAKDGDTAVIDFEGFKDGVPFEGGKGENYSLVLGSRSFVPGFEEQVVGMKAGEEKDIDITFPEEYTPELAGKAVVFHVKVNEVKEKELPAMDDEFAKDASEFDTLEELKENIRSNITAEREETAKRDFEDELMVKVADGITADIPQVMIDTQVENFVESFKNRIQSQMGIPFEQYMKFANVEESKLYEDAKEPSLRQVKLNLALTEIIKVENIEATDEEIEAEYERAAKMYGMDAASLKSYITKDAVADEVKRDKAVKLITESAIAADAAAAEPEKKPAKKRTTKKKAEEAPAEEKTEEQGE